MHLNELIQAYEREKLEAPETADQLLDFCQKQYINGSLSSQSYRELFQQLHQEGAESPHKETEPV
ncbi:YppF family protein [Pontibacillus sp. HMF3514]|uniref:YppF family protein n=1 Tax=Pontibacillus sp. HMF3514 TaxID=2692425 RepID=UPI00131FBB29|nr:YppF family protein [Pontibacillus sp. HMF3514]QHE51420.1 hypothetical protein GS400_04950 [Pontibacillus sp. HMF3514]